MKNLLIYINPIDKKFSQEHDTLTKIQIDNSLKFGWKHEDILLVTNFKYKYHGIKALVIGDKNYCEFSPCGSKIYAIVTLFELGLIGEDLYWFHDNDAFQLEKNIDPKMGGADIGMVVYDNAPMGHNYAGAHRWNSGIIFFKKTSKDFFNITKKRMQSNLLGEERAFMRIQNEEKQNNLGVTERTKILNLTYNFIPSNSLIHFEKRYTTAERPIKIIHFDPFDPMQNKLSQFPHEYRIRLYCQKI